MGAATPSSDSAPARPSRSERSRLAICEACLDLLQEGVLQPSADQVAERSGVSRRSIFNHFGDLAELYDAVAAVGMERCAPLLAEISAEGPVGRRLERLMDQRVRFLEATAPYTRALTAQALVGGAPDQALRISRDALKLQERQLARLFRRELAALERGARQETLEALSAALNPLLWESLRHSQGYPVARARGVVTRTLSALLPETGV